MARRLLLAAIAALGAALLLLPTGAPAASQTVPSIELDGEISPATEAWMGSALDDAADDDAPLVIVRLDTPGGRSGFCHPPPGIISRAPHRCASR